MREHSRGARVAQRRGSVLVPVMVLIGTLMAMTVTLLGVSTRHDSEVASNRDGERARVLAQAGLSEAVTAVRAGASGGIGSMDAPARLGDGIFWVTAEELDGDNVQLVSTALVGSGRSALALVIERQGGELGDLFRATLNSRETLTMSADVTVDSFDSAIGTYAEQMTNFDHGRFFANDNGDVLSNQDIVLNSRAGVFGDATPGPGYSVIDVATDAFVTGSTAPASNAFEFPTIEVPSYGSVGPLIVGGAMTLPAGDYEYDSLTLDRNAELIVEGPANIVIGDAFMGGKDARLRIDATNGPVTVYCDSYLHGRGFETVAVDGSAAAVAFLVHGETDIVFPSASIVRGAFYAESANVVFTSDNEAWGSFVGNQINMSSSMKFHFDESLARYWDGGGGGAGEIEVESQVRYETRVQPRRLLSDRRDPLVLLDLEHSELRSPVEAWIPLE